MHISNFRKVKRVGDVVGAFAGIRKSVSARLVMVGDGPERAHAYEEVERYGLTGRRGVSRQARVGGGTPVLRRPVPAAQRAGVVRARGARGDGQRSARDRDDRFRPGRGRGGRTSPGSCTRSATSRRWPRAACGC